MVETILMGNFKKFSKKAKAALNINSISKSIREEIGLQMASLFSNEMTLLNELNDLFEDGIPTKKSLPEDFPSDFKIMRNKGDGAIDRSIVYWYYLHSLVDDIEPANKVDLRAFEKQSKTNPDDFVPATYREAYGEPVFEKIEAQDPLNPRPDDTKLIWDLELLDEKTSVDVHFYDLTCDLKLTNETTDSPAKFIIFPFMETRAIPGLKFGFKQAVIETSLNQREAKAEITFNKIYETGVENCGAQLIKNKPKHKGKWTLKNGGVPLNDEYAFDEHEVMGIKFSGWELSFSVEFRIDQFSLYVCHTDGDAIDQKGREAILKMLVIEHQLIESKGEIIDMLLTTKNYRLRKVDPYAT